MMRRKTRRNGIVAAALSVVAALAMTSCQAGADDGEFYSGKQLTLYVPYEAGGGTDLAARALAPLLKKHLPGNPDVIVENDPSTGGIIGANGFAADKDRDGETILVSSSALHSSYLVGDPTVRVDFNDLTPLLGMATGSLVFVSDKTGITDPTQIVDPPKDSLILAGQVPSGSDLRTLLALDLVGADYKAIFGYEGSGDKRIAFERDEVNLMLDNSISYRQQMQKLADAGEVIPIMSQGLMVGDTLERVPSLPDLMTPTELYAEVTGNEATGEDWDAYRTLVASTDSLSKALWFHSDDPDEAKDAITTALQEIIDTPEDFSKLKDDVFGGNPALMGDDLDAVVDTMANPDESTREYLRNYLVDRWDVKF